MVDHRRFPQDPRPPSGQPPTGPPASRAGRSFPRIRNRRRVQDPSMAWNNHQLGQGTPTFMDDLWMVYGWFMDVYGRYMELFTYTIHIYKYYMVYST